MKKQPYITIIPHKKGGRQLYSSCDYFQGSDYFTYELKDDSLTIFKHYIIIPDNAKKITRVNENQIHLYFRNENIPLGKYLIDLEESNQDKIKIYFEDIIK